MTRPVNIHATCIVLDRAARAFGAPAAAGVLLLGDSGSGKSDLALRLIGRGARLVADDRTDLVVSRGRLIGRAPASLAGLIEIRGVGIVAMPHAASARIVLVVDLSGAVRRLPDERSYVPPKPLVLPPNSRPPLIALAAFEASAPDRIVAALGASRHDRLRSAVKRN